jgi:secreted trypsin-like serine protease
VIGSNTVDDGERINVIESVQHDDYDSITDGYDVGLLFLESSTTLETFPILNTDNDLPYQGATTYAMGWGDTDVATYEKVSESLMIVDLKVITNEDCDAAEEGDVSYRNWVKDDMLCTYSENHDACQGDSGMHDLTLLVTSFDLYSFSTAPLSPHNLSCTLAFLPLPCLLGGPLILRPGGGAEYDILVGLVSWGVGCAYLPGVFSRVSMSYDWIKNTTCAESRDPTGSFCELDRNSGFDYAQASSSTSTSVSCVWAPLLVTDADIEPVHISHMPPLPYIPRSQVPPNIFPVLVARGTANLDPVVIGRTD